jgi:hypothetical protein
MLYPRRIPCGFFVVLQYFLAVRCGAFTTSSISSCNRRSSAVAFLSTWVPPQQQRSNSAYIRLFSSSSSSNNESKDVITNTKNLEYSQAGLYRKFADHVWQELEATGWLSEMVIQSEFCENIALAKGAVAEGTVVKMTTRAMVPAIQPQPQDPPLPIRYARYALLETLTPSNPTSDSENVVQTKGIQVLNLVVFPSDTSDLPVLGIDLVSLPGDKHLLLLDAQPMALPNQYEENWKEWHAKYVRATTGGDNGDAGDGDPEKDTVFPWGGDIPAPVAKYVSKYALWTRLVGKEGVDVIQNELWDAFKDHLREYLELLKQQQQQQQRSVHANKAHANKMGDQASYIDYRRNNDPAKPMLKALYGEEWTNQVLEQVLFPSPTNNNKDRA